MKLDNSLKTWLETFAAYVKLAEDPTEFRDFIPRGMIDYFTAMLITDMIHTVGKKYLNSYCKGGYDPSFFVTPVILEALYMHLHELMGDKPRKPHWSKEFGL